MQLKEIGVRTTAYLPPELYDILASVKKFAGLPKSVVIRESLSEYFERRGYKVRGRGRSNKINKASEEVSNVIRASRHEI